MKFSSVVLCTLAAFSLTVSAGGKCGCGSKKKDAGDGQVDAPQESTLPTPGDKPAGQPPKAEVNPPKPTQVVPTPVVEVVTPAPIVPVPQPAPVAKPAPVAPVVPAAQVDPMVLKARDLNAKIQPLQKAFSESKNKFSAAQGVCNQACGKQVEVQKAITELADLKKQKAEAVKVKNPADKNEHAKKLDDLQKEIGQKVEILGKQVTEVAKEYNNGVVSINVVLKELEEMKKELTDIKNGKEVQEIRQFWQKSQNSECYQILAYPKQLLTGIDFFAKEIAAYLEKIGKQINEIKTGTPQSVLEKEKYDDAIDLRNLFGDSPLEEKGVVMKAIDAATGAVGNALSYAASFLPFGNKKPANVVSAK